jgi:hypothetical protein
VVDLSQAQTNLQVTTAMVVPTGAAPAGTTTPFRRDTGTAAILLSYAAGGAPDAASDPLLATIIYW